MPSLYLAPEAPPHMTIVNTRTRCMTISRLTAILAGTLMAVPAAAQTPAVFTACYVPSSGTVYRIDKPSGSAPGSPNTCGTSKRSVDVEFSWTDGADAIRLTSLAGGDLAGTFGSLTTAKLLGRTLAATPPAAGQVLTWNAATNEWTPTTPAGGVTAHAALSGLAADDHSQYLLADGVRTSLNGFAVGGTLGQGTLLPPENGPRLLWYPKKAAFRAGYSSVSYSADVNIGEHSIALGRLTQASGSEAIALGPLAQATGALSSAFGPGARATGDRSTAIGVTSTASGLLTTAIGISASSSSPYAVALGNFVEATQSRAFAVGTAVSAIHEGAFVFGDGVNLLTHTPSTGNNQFTGRFSGGYRFRTNVAMTTGCDLPAGSGVFSCTSSRTLKSDFLPLDGESLLAKVRDLPIMSWRYTGESTAVRHVGPFAEDFRAAFGLGTDSLSIGVLDEAGVGLAGVQALEARTKALRAETAALREENIALRARLERIEARLRSSTSRGR